MHVPFLYLIVIMLLLAWAWYAFGLGGLILAAVLAFLGRGT